MNYITAQKMLRNFILVVLLCLPYTFLQADDTEIYLNIDADQCGAPSEKYRFIFIVDNSGSMSSTEFTQSKSTVDATISAVLASGLPDLEVSVVQYGTNHYSQEHKYDVTVPFTDDETTALNWGRVFGPGGSGDYWDLQDHLPASLARMRHENVYGAGGALDIEDATNVQIVFFTDAWRSGSINWGACCSDLVGGGPYDNTNGTYTTDVDFGEYNRLKNGSLLVNSAGVGIQAQFTVLNTNTRSDAQGAAAAIASPGGDWTGVVEANAGDPEGSGTKPRRYIQGSFSQSDTTQLVELVEEVISELKATTFSQVAPAVAVNAFNQLQHRNDIYYSIFKPIQSPRWDGNVKKYFITADPEIQDQNDISAIDDVTGSIKKSALSYWSGGSYPSGTDEVCSADSDSCTATADGAEVVVGGFREQLTNTRTVFTDGSALECHTQTPVPTGCSSGLIQISATSEIQDTLLGTDSSTATTDVAEFVFDVIGGASLDVASTIDTNNLLFNNSSTTTNLFSARAKTDLLSATGSGVDLSEPYEIEFNLQSADLVGNGTYFTVGLESTDPGANPTNSTPCDLDFGLYFWGNSSKTLRIVAGCFYQFFDDGSINNSYTDGDQFRMVIDGDDYEIYKNDVLIASDTNLGALNAGQDYFVEVGAYERTTLSNAFELTDFVVYQDDVGVALSTGAVSRSDLLSWLIGIDVFNDDEDGSSTDANNFISDSLHARPVVVNFGGTGSTLAQQEQNPYDVIFHTTNVGVLHAIKAGRTNETNDTGEELWSYIPSELLGNPIDYVLDDDLATEHTYGLDADMTIWSKRDSIGAVPSQVYLYMGQRRGGRNYFALNVTNASGQTLPSGATTCTNTTDKLCRLFTITGGTTQGFGSLGETWAKPIRTRINTACTSSGNCTTKDVLILSGGYDDKYDDDSKTLETIESEGVLGNHIYIVDAENGDLLWSAGETDPGVSGDYFLSCNGSGSSSCTSTMNHSFVSSPSALDMDRDGSIDTIFAIDIAGRIWRFDFRATSSEEDGELHIQTSAGGIIADLSASNVKRRFYTKLDVAITEVGDELRFNLVTGSGYRAHPKTQETAGNNFYIVYDNNILAPAFDGSGEAEYDYYEISSTVKRTVVNSDIPVIDPILTPFDPTVTHKHGFYVELTDRDDEKVLNPTITFANKVFGVSYLPAPNVSTSDACALGSSKVYIIDLLDPDGNGAATVGETSTVSLNREGIVAEGVLLYLLDDNNTSSNKYDDTLEPTICFGTECFNLEDDLGAESSIDIGKASKSYWWETDREN